MRKFKPYSPIQEFFMTDCFICDEDDPEDNVYAKLIERYNKNLETPLILPRIPLMNQSINPMNMSAYIPHIPPPPRMESQVQKSQSISDNSSAAFRPPSLSELLSAKNQLKPTKTIIKTVNQGKVVDSDELETNIINPPPPPPIPKKSDEKSPKKSDEKSYFKKSDEKSPNKSDEKSPKKPNEKSPKKPNEKSPKKSDKKPAKKIQSESSDSGSDSDSDSDSDSQQ